MKVHVFGNCTSPAVAISSIKRTAIEGEEGYGIDIKFFVDRHFYIDDGLKPFSRVEEVVDLLKRAQHMFAQTNL